MTGKNPLEWGEVPPPTPAIHIAEAIVEQANDLTPSPTTDATDDSERGKPAVTDDIRGRLSVLQGLWDQLYSYRRGGNSAFRRGRGDAVGFWRRQ